MQTHPTEDLNNPFIAVVKGRLSSFLWGYLGRAAPWAPFKAVGWPQMEDMANSCCCGTGWLTCPFVPMLTGWMKLKKKGATYFGDWTDLDSLQSWQTVASYIKKRKLFICVTVAEYSWQPGNIHKCLSNEKYFPPFHVRGKVKHGVNLCNPSEHIQTFLTTEKEAALETAPYCVSIAMWWCKEPLLKASLLFVKPGHWTRTFPGN